MSSRALRRLQQEKEKTVGDLGESLEDQESFVQCGSIKKKSKRNNQSGNIFDLLSDDIDSLEISEGETLEEDSNKNSHVPVVKLKTKRKKNKKGMSASETSGNDDLDKIEEEINKASEELFERENRNTDVTSQIKGYATPTLNRKSVLLVDPRNLSTQNEMKKRFGANVVNANNRRRDTHNRRFKRTTVLVTPQDNWPPYTKVGITMMQDKSQNNGLSYFRFAHQDIYRSVQFKFYDAVDSMDHNNIIALLNAHPYHVDSMLQLSEICRMNEDHRMAGELIERSLFVFECGFHTLFNITQGTCRLDYRKAENRPFFLALYRHITYIGDKGCYRTALEFCKVLFGLDPAGDPLAVLLMLDYYALKAEEYHYLLQVFEEYDFVRNLFLLPNFAFSVPLAKFLIGSQKEGNELLRRALIQFPSMLIELTEKIGVDIDNNIRSHPHFDPVSFLKQSSPLNLLISLYVGRCHAIWKQPEVLDWLVENAKHIVDNLDQYESEVESSITKRITCFRFSPPNVLRHVLTSDIKEAIGRLPIDVRGQSVMTHDPLPPEDSIVEYERPQRQNGNGHDVNMLSLFWQSLMPSFNHAAANGDLAENVNQQPPQLEAPLGAEGGLNNVADGARRVMDVMRDLLASMTYRNDGEQNGEEGNDNEEFDDQDWH